MEYIIFSGREGTIVHGGGNTIEVSVGVAFEIVGADPSIDGHHIVTYVDSASQFRFATRLSARKIFGGKIHIHTVTGLVSGSEVDVINPAHNHECLAGYFCNGDFISNVASQVLFVLWDQ